MNLIEQPNRWSCGLASLAMLLDQPIGLLVDLIGHDGSALLDIDPTAKEPFNRRSFVIDDLQLAVFKLGYALAGFEADPTIADTNIKVFDSEPELRIMSVMRGRPGLIEGCYAFDKPHMVAWDGSRVFDPTGPRAYSFDDLTGDRINILCFWMLCRLAA